MQLIVTGRHVRVTGAMKEYAREKLGRVVTRRPLPAAGRADQIGRASCRNGE